MTLFKKLIRQYLYYGVNEQRPAEVNRQIVVINLFAAVGFSITFILGITAWSKAETMLSISLIIASLVFYMSHQVLRINSLEKGYRISANLLLYCLMSLMLYLIYSGGTNNTGPMWIFLVPPVALFFGGLRKGLRDIGMFVILASVLMFVNDGALLLADYTYEFKTRLLYSFLTATFLSAFYEYSREESYKQIQELSNKFETQARQDPLTRLPNRRCMKEHLDYEFNRSKRSQKPMSVILCDIDYFKKINDSHGHDAGDEVLKQISETFNSSMRSQDIVARWGGEEFLFLLPETSAEEAFILAEKIRFKVLNYNFYHNEKAISVTVSMGVCQVNPDNSIDEAINVADHQLYDAKARGRNQTRPLLVTK